MKPQIPLLVFLLACNTCCRGPQQEVGPDTPLTRSARDAKVERGSQTAKGGFQNEDEICNKFNDWKADADAQLWLQAMHYQIADVVNVTATKPHGKKADVEVIVSTNVAVRVERISVKLVSNPTGFNQIDKRWLKTYATQWNMPAEVHEALKSFVGEVPPTKPSRNDKRIFLNEFDDATQKAVVEFFVSRREEIVSDLIAGDGDHAADWMMVTLKVGDTGHKERNTEGKMHESLAAPTRTPDTATWTIRSTADAIRFYGDGEIRITPAGNLKIGRITMQRKGGDNGRATANMLQFKINPAELFEMPRVESELDDVK